MQLRAGTVLLLWLDLLLILAPAVTLAAATAQPESNSYAFVDVSVIPMDRDGVLRHQTVVVTGDRIVAMGPVARVTPPDGTLRIDGTGRFLMPGLVDAHIHLVSEYDLSLLLANGVTTVRNMNGRPIHLRWRDEVASGARLGPRIITAAPMVGEVPRELRVGPAAADVDARVHESAAAGYDFIKIGDALSATELADVTAAAAPHGLDVVGHAPDGTRVADLLRHGLRSLEHMDGMTGMPDAELETLLPAMAETLLWVVPTLTIWQHYRPVAGELSPAQLALAGYLSKTGRTSLCLTPGERERPHELSRPPARYLKLVADLHAAGVPLMLGTDAPCLCATPGDSVGQELRNLVAAGLSPYAALRTATANPAEFLGMADEFGSVGVGKRADLLLLEQNPLVDLAAVGTIEGVMVAGRWLTADDLEELQQ